MEAAVVSEPQARSSCRPPALGARGGLVLLAPQRTRELAEEVASELSKVTWPTRNEVTNSTAVVIVTTLFSTIFFALMDRFWGFLTNLGLRNIESCEDYEQR